MNNIIIYAAIDLIALTRTNDWEEIVKLKKDIKDTLKDIQEKYPDEYYFALKENQNNVK